ncbi:MAG: prepilin-type N-terminal cleavage/methylation domain-containing protein, partial [Phycisphaerae bacterium]|nr:prepilin-type N-terminal cleavage/methylation domain-containing protein [Phycisphaerae bacterium]
MKKSSNTFTERPGFSLAEVLTAMVIAAMVMVTVLGIYSRAESTADTIKRKFDSSRLPTEVLQRIAEDLDQIMTTDAYTTISIQNKFEKGFPTAQLTITKTVVGTKKPMTFENIVWQTNYDYDSDSLVLYRQRTSELGLLEDKLLDEERENWEQALFVPICEGITFFEIKAVRNGELLDKFVGRMPLGIQITISFAEPFKTLTNTFDVFDEQKFTRTVAVDRTRKIKFKIAPKQEKKPEGDLTEGAEKIEEK